MSDPDRGGPLWAGREEQEAARWLPPTDATDRWEPPAPATAWEPPGAATPWQQPSGPPSAPAEVAGRPLAGYGQRAGAAVVDFLVRFGIILAFGFVGAIALVGGEDAGSVGVWAGVITGGVVATVVYAPVMMARTGGQTVGHRVARIRVVMVDGRRITGGRAFVREVLVKAVMFEGIGGFLFLVPTLLNYLWPLWDDQREALHDKICATRVVEA